MKPPMDKTPSSIPVASYADLLQTLIEICTLLNGLQIEYRLGGSFVINVHAGRCVIEAGDLDFVCKTKAMHDRMIDALVTQLGFIQTKQVQWEGDAGEENMNTNLTSPTGVLVEVAWVNDIILADEASTVLVHDCPISVFSLVDMKATYEEFRDRKPGAEEKLALIDQLLNKERVDELSK